MSKLIPNFFILIAILCASPMAYLLIIGFVFVLSNVDSIGDLIPVSVLILGALGYIGLWSLMLHKTNTRKLQTLSLLICGVTVFVILAIVTELSAGDIRHELFQSTNQGLTLMVIYPNILALFYILKLSKKLIDGKKRD